MFKLYGDIFVGAFISVYRSKWTLLQTLLIPVIASAILDLLFPADYKNSSMVLLGICHAIIYCLITIATHRIIILGPRSVSFFGIYKIGKRELKFALYLLLLFLMMTILWAVLAVIDLLSELHNELVVLSVVYLVVGRFSLVFPGIAVDAEATFDISWELTRGHTILMFFVVGVVPTVLYSPFTLIDSELLGMEILGSVLASIALVLEIAFISQAYVQISERSYAR